MHTQKALDFKLNLDVVARKDTFQKKLCYIACCELNGSTIPCDMEHAHKEEREMARDARLRRHELRELDVTKRYEKLESRKENLQRDRTFARLDIYASRKHLS